MASFRSSLGSVRVLNWERVFFCAVGLPGTHRYNTYVTGLETRVNSVPLRVALVIELQYTVQPGIPEPGLALTVLHVLQTTPRE